MTKLPSFLTPAAALAMGALLVVSSASCRKRTSLAEVPPSQKELPPELALNTMASQPGPVYQSQASSPIRWQAWTPATLADAKASNRLIFAVIVMPQQPVFQQVLDDLASDPALVKKISENYVPVLIDANAAREMQLLAITLCVETKSQIQFPFFLWMSPDGNPVNWVSVPARSPEENIKLFKQNESVVGGMWRDTPAYVTKNSAQSQERRMELLQERRRKSSFSEDPSADAVAALRQMLSLYDEGSRSLDEGGGLFPVGAIDLLASAAIIPGLPEDLRRSSREKTRMLLEDLLPTAMFDPLDGGVFSARYQSYASLPSFERDASTQARVSLALLRAYQLTGNPLALEKALDAITFAEKNYTTTEGLFASGFGKLPHPEQWLWGMEDLEKLLSPADAAWWAKITGVTHEGNIPPEADPLRRCFRLNSLSRAHTLADLTAASKTAPADFLRKYERIRQELLTTRNQRIGPVAKDDFSHAATTFRMVSAYAAAYVATGDAAYREKAALLLERARAIFGSGLRLQMYSGSQEPSIAEGRAFLYGLAIQAILDVADVTLDEKWWKWADDLSSTAAQIFRDGDYLRECPKEVDLMGMALSDQLKMFDDTTAGLFAYAGSRVQGRPAPAAESLSPVNGKFPKKASARPMLYTDLIQAALTRDFSSTVVMGENLPAPLQKAVSCLPIRVIKRRQATPQDGVAAGTVKVVSATGRIVEASNPDQLQEAVLPSR